MGEQEISSPAEQAKVVLTAAMLKVYLYGRLYFSGLFPAWGPFASVSPFYALHYHSLPRPFPVVGSAVFCAGSGTRREIDPHW